MKNLILGLFGQDVAKQGEVLAKNLSQRFPLSLDGEGLPKLSAERLERILERVYADAQALRDDQRLGYLRRVRLCHAFQWRLREMGYSKPFVDLATEGLVVYLNKPLKVAPAAAQAQAKRERKATRAREQVNPTVSVNREAGGDNVVVAPSSFSRNNPSPRYAELTRLYRQMHEKGESFLHIKPEDTFPGQSLPPQAKRIKGLIDANKARRILDYGSGKGMQYQARDITLPDVPGKWPSIQAYWAVDAIHCFDPSYAPFSELPRGAFDGVISTDVLEHCPEEDVPWIIDEIFSYARKFVFMNVACYPAKKRLPTGENAHCTIKPKEWWAGIIQDTARKHPDVKYEVWIQWKEAGSLAEEVIRG